MNQAVCAGSGISGPGIRMSYWSVPPLIKVYEALGCLADGHLEVEGDLAKCYSSSRGKFYTVRFDQKTQAIMMNDNGSYWQGYLGYPGIAFLMQRGLLPYDAAYAKALANIHWKDVNQKFQNDFEKTRVFVEKLAGERGVTAGELKSFGELVLQIIEAKPFLKFGRKLKPPAGY